MPTKTKSAQLHIICQNRLQIWNARGQIHIKSAFTHILMSFGYVVMKNKIASGGHLGFS